jgi:hypothetical protein
VALFREARCEKTAMPSSSYLADKFPRCFFQAPQEALDWIPARKRELREKQATVIGTALRGVTGVCGRLRPSDAHDQFSLWQRSDALAVFLEPRLQINISKIVFEVRTSGCFNSRRPYSCLPSSGTKPLPSLPADGRAAGTAMDLSAGRASLKARGRLGR